MRSSFQAEGYIVRTTLAPDTHRASFVEVYPHPALLSLLNRDKRVPYKISKSNKYWPDTTVSQRIDNLAVEFNAILAALTAYFGVLSIPMPPAADVARLAFLKRYEDALDALICAWMGAQFVAGRAVALGDETAAIWCPRDIVHG